MKILNNKVEIKLQIKQNTWVESFNGILSTQKQQWLNCKEIFLLN